MEFQLLCTMMMMLFVLSFEDFSASRFVVIANLGAKLARVLRAGLDGGGLEQLCSEILCVRSPKLRDHSGDRAWTTHVRE